MILSITPIPLCASDSLYIYVLFLFSLLLGILVYTNQIDMFGMISIFQDLIDTSFFQINQKTVFLGHFLLFKH